MGYKRGLKKRTHQFGIVADLLQLFMHTLLQFLALFFSGLLAMPVRLA
jgi:uncharacterized membrane protein (DUF485 family)